MSYTEMEYRYALSQGKPTIAFLHRDPSSLPLKLTEKSSEGQKKLESFRTLAQNKMCKNWENAKELGSVVSRSLVSLQRKHPGIGWVKGNVISDKDAQLEILKLKSEIETYKKELEIKQSAPVGSEKYAQGKDKVLIHYSFESTDKDGEVFAWDHSEQITWDEIFFWVLPLMMDEATDTLIRKTIAEFLYNKCSPKYKNDKDIKDHTVQKFNITNNDFQTVIIQARALGLIKNSERLKSPGDVNRYWTLTQYGDTLMTSLRAIKRSKK
jgi:hypothetical protein